jgi:hypothetical protein
MEEDNLTQEQKQERVYNLTVELRDMEAKKKSVSGGYNAEIKRLKAEIKDLVKADQETFEIA